ncbi:hypothetical protein KQX54_003653 [Cotesia glomerata]|uniref:Uncharacterized protein n=1 Tax=Cotesia glomerata TaxID=32391 RepID=A0AAV7I1J4_COTGL|nr:hypothetical protein KQX54_003653 [Cotesia glomerata]
MSDPGVRLQHYKGKEKSSNKRGSGLAADPLKTRERFYYSKKDDQGLNEIKLSPGIFFRESLQWRQSGTDCVGMNFRMRSMEC